MQVIVYPTETGVAIITPAPGFDIEAIAAKDVPEGAEYGFIDSAALPDYSTRSRWVWNEGTIEVGPEPDPPAVVQMSFAQLLTGLVAEGWITEAEGTAWLGGTLPAAALALIGQLPAAQRFGAKAKAARPSVVVLSDPLVQALAAAQGKSGDLPAFFNTHGAI